MVGRAHTASMSRHNAPGLLSRLAGGLLKLALPVAFLLTAGAACVIYSDLPAKDLGTFAGRPLSVGVALLPVTFFVIHLTNRRYGATCAFAQVLAAWVLAMIALPSFLPMIPQVPDTRVLAGFAAGLFVAQLAAVVLFDRLRGPTWWKAPFFASLFGGLLLCLIAFPLAFAGTSAGWPGEMIGFVELATGASFLLLVPYGLLRSVVPPQSGFGGY
jgi:uncharacterized PurR-regulated membrane protein YhhQ (DUF165 family)